MRGFSSSGHMEVTAMGPDWPAIFMSVSAAIADPLLRRTAGGLAPRPLSILQGYASGPQGSGRRSRDAAQQFRDEPS
jgi:hypothetical protein